MVLSIARSPAYSLYQPGSWNVTQANSPSCHSLNHSTIEQILYEMFLPRTLKMSDFTGSTRDTQKHFFWEFRLNFLASRVLCCRPVVLLSYAVSVDSVANSETLCSLMFLEEYNIAWLCEIHVYLHMSPNVEVDLQWRGLIWLYISCHLVLYSSCP